jgi:hypothetical protein
MTKPMLNCGILAPYVGRLKEQYWKSLSTLPLKVDMGCATADVCYGPIANIDGDVSPPEKSGLFLHLISLFCAN